MHGWGAATWLCSSWEEARDGADGREQCTRDVMRLACERAGLLTMEKGFGGRQVWGFRQRSLAAGTETGTTSVVSEGWDRGPVQVRERPLSKRRLKHGISRPRYSASLVT